jgi:hypothetical protein
MSQSLRLTNKALQIAKSTFRQGALAPMPALSSVNRATAVDLRTTITAQTYRVRLQLARVPKQRPVNLVNRPIHSLPEQQRFPLTIDFSRKDVRLPFGVPRFVNAATLRTMAGRENGSSRLLKKIGNAWEFVADDSMIDLEDRSVQFRLGQVTILS